MRDVDELLEPNRIYLTDAGLETDMVFNRCIELPFFSSATLLRTDEGRQQLVSYFRDFLELACARKAGCILETATWRASPDWAAPLGLDPAELDMLNEAAVRMLLGLKARHASPDTPVLVSGCLGPRGDGYDPGLVMSVVDATTYHHHQAETLVKAGADLLSAITMTNVPEATGVVLAAKSLDRPVVISFTVETDGRLPSGDGLAEAVAAVDQATACYPAYFMINCAHPTHFLPLVHQGGDWRRRICGVRANASRCSHAELDAMPALDDGDPAELAELYAELRRHIPTLRVLGGCCGTDLRHVSAIADRCLNA
jgi:homocysteine S-methyltransferase